VFQANHDPILYDHPMPFRGHYYPLGFPLTIDTNSEEILAAAFESWSCFPQRFETRPLHLRVGVSASDSRELPIPRVRAQGHLISFIGSSEAFAVGDLESGFGYAWLSPFVVQNRDVLRYHYLESLVLTMIDSLHVCTVHAACVALDGCGVLICGRSGAGKSTLAYACAKDGWQYVSDDASSLVKGREDRVVLGNSHRLRLRPDAGLLFPEFRDRLVMARASGKPSIEIATAKEPQIDRLLECNIHHVLFLDRAQGARAVLCPYPKERALEELSAVICFGPPEQREARIACYRNLLEVPVFQMQYDDLDEAVQCLRAMVRNQSCSNTRSFSSSRLVY
jgi:hypothetical protein